MDGRWLSIRLPYYQASVSAKILGCVNRHASEQGHFTYLGLPRSLNPEQDVSGGAQTEEGWERDGESSRA